MSKINNAIKWTIDRGKHPKLTGTITLKYDINLDDADPTEIEMEYAKQHIRNELKRRCATLGLDSNDRADIYLAGYLDGMNGFDPKVTKEIE